MKVTRIVRVNPLARPVMGKLCGCHEINVKTDRVPCWRRHRIGIGWGSSSYALLLFRDNGRYFNEILALEA